MSKDHNHEFKIEGFKPDTMPFNRLVEYFGKLRAMFSKPECVHLVGIRDGSVASAFSIDHDQEHDVLEDLRTIQHGSASKQARKAYEEINRMLSEDGAEAVFIDRSGQNIVAFPGSVEDRNVLHTPVGEVSVSGNLYHLAGTRDSVKLRVSTMEYGTVHADADANLAICLRELLFEDVRIVGKGQWERGLDRVWRPRHLHVTQVDRLRNETLSEALQRLETVSIKWPDDPLALMKAIREEGEDSQ